MLITPMLDLRAWDRRTARSLRLVWVTQLRSCPPSKCNAAGPQAKVLPACAHPGTSLHCRYPCQDSKSLRGNRSRLMHIVLSLVTTDLKGSGLDWELECEMHKMTLEHPKYTLVPPPGPVPGEDRLPRTHRQKAGRKTSFSTSWGASL